MQARPAFKKTLSESVDSVLAVAKPLLLSGWDVNLVTVNTDDGSIPEAPDVVAIKGDKTVNIEVRQHKQISFTCAEDFPHNAFLFYRVDMFNKLKTPPDYVYMVNAECSHAGVIHCANQDNWKTADWLTHPSYYVKKEEVQTWVTL